MDALKTIEETGRRSEVEKAEVKKRLLGSLPSPSTRHAFPIPVLLWRIRRRTGPACVGVLRLPPYPPKRSQRVPARRRRRRTGGPHVLSKARRKRHSRRPLPTTRPPPEPAATKSGPRQAVCLPHRPYPSSALPSGRGRSEKPHHGCPPMGKARWRRAMCGEAVARARTRRPPCSRPTPASPVGLGEGPHV